jgi:lipoprotein LpqB-like beta-propeller protein/sporulation and spore germination protein
VASYRPVRLPGTLAAIAAVAAIAGCANAPSGGPPKRAIGTGSEVQAYVQPLPPPPPTKAWGQTAVVLGFLHASASYAFDPAAAEQYLAPPLRKSWHPASGPVAVVGQPTGISVTQYKPQIEGTTEPNVPLVTVTLIGQRLATLSPTGQYQYAPGQNIPYRFILARINGVWLIDGLPQGQPGLMLTQSDFESVYQARNLFFYAPAEPSQPVGVLVPDPVYAPLQSSNSALNTNLATGLVNGLLKGPGDWLNGATHSAFPAGTHLIKQVTITGRVARVDLGGTAVHASDAQIELMEAQLRTTLGDRSYAAPLASQVQLYLNNALQYSWPASSSNLVTPVGAGPVLAVTGSGSVVQLPVNPRAGAIPAVRATAAQIGQAAVTAIAAEPARGRTPPIAIAVQDETGCAVLLSAGSQASYHSYVLSTSGGQCTSLSWDSNGNLWAAAGHAVWVLPPQNRRPIPVDVTALAATGQSGSQILALRMAPDNVRAALLVQTRSGNKMLLAAVRFGRLGVAFSQPVSIGAGNVSPVAISWSDPYHLALLTSSGVIFAVPLTGGAGLQPGGSPQQLGTAPGRVQTLTTDGSELVVGAVDGGVDRIFASSPALPGWSAIMTGSNPVYPG